jgi:hypothetical protein
MRIAGWVVGVLVVAAGLSVWTAPPAGACSCVARSDGEALATADAVFIGKVTGYDDPRTGPVFSSADMVTWTFAVDEVFKGNVAAEQAVLSAAEDASCGLAVSAGGYYMVFAEHADAAAPAAADRPLAAGLCGGTREAAPGEQPPGFPTATSVTAASVTATSVTTEPADVADEAAPVLPDDDGGWRRWVVPAIGVGGVVVAGLVVAGRRNRRA